MYLYISFNLFYVTNHISCSKLSVYNSILDWIDRYLPNDVKRKFFLLLLIECAQVYSVPITRQISSFTYYKMLVGV